MSGVFYIGSSDQFDGDTVQAYPLGSVTVLPGNPSHFHRARSGEYVAQVTAIGPLILQYLDPGDDPRSGGAPWSRRRAFIAAWAALLSRVQNDTLRIWEEAWHPPGRVLDNADRREQRAAHLYACLGHHG
jgi:hypothetical protein